MPRSVNAVASRQRRKKILKQTKGNFLSRSNVWTVAKNTWEKGLSYAYADRTGQEKEFQVTVDYPYQCRSQATRHVLFRIYRQAQ